MVLLPAITVGYRYSAVTMRLTRSAMLEVMREDYIRTARAKGLLEQIIVNRHALKNALLPVVTLIGIEFAFLIGGLVITEQVFNLNGIGRLLVQAVQNQDNVLAQALVMLIVASLRGHQPRGRRALRLARPAHPLFVSDPMAVITPTTAPADDDTEALLRQRTPLAPGAQLRPPQAARHDRPDHRRAVRRAAGIFADWIAPFDPEENDFASMMMAPELAHCPRHRPVRPRHLLAPGLRRAHRDDRRLRRGGRRRHHRHGAGRRPRAYFGGWFDLILQRIFDILMAFPLIILALAVVSVFGTGVFNVVIAITIPLVPRCGRVVRASALAVREVPYVDAARALGFGHARIVLCHMVPNVLAPFLILLSAFVGQAILAEASLSYLGLGVQEPVAAWGLMLQGSAEDYATTAPWIAIFPGLAIVLTVLGASLFGDALRDAIDPKLRDR